MDLQVRERHDLLNPEDYPLDRNAPQNNIALRQRRHLEDGSDTIFL